MHARQELYKLSYVPGPKHKLSLVFDCSLLWERALKWIADIKNEVFSIMPGTRHRVVELLLSVYKALDSTPRPMKAMFLLDFRDEDEIWQVQ